MKHFINLKDISSLDLKKIILEAKDRKKKRKNFNILDVDKDKPLKGKLLIQMFEKSSTRTRLSFYLAIKQLGGGALTLRPDELHFAKGESLADTAKILSTFGNAFMLRTDSDKKLKEFTKYIGIPIINGLSPSSHPTQVLSDVFTVEEIKKKPISKLKISWIGDGNNNVINSLIVASVKFSFNLNIGCPKKYEPKKQILNWVKKNKKKIYIFNNANQAAKNADVIFTDKVVSMNDRINKSKKIKEFKNFRVNSKVMSQARKDAIFLHCLPRGSEVSSDVFLGKQSKVWQQAYNRIHVQKSILLWCFEKK